MVPVWVYFKFCSICGAPLLAEMMTDMVAPFALILIMILKNS